MITHVTFYHVPVIFSIMSSLETHISQSVTTKVQCGRECERNEYCGGYVWDGTLAVSNCAIPLDFKSSFQKCISPIGDLLLEGRNFFIGFHPTDLEV